MANARRLRVVGAVVALAGAAFFLATRPADPRGALRVVMLPQGASALAIAARLEEEGLVRHRLGFLLVARVRGLARRLQGGEYRLSPAMTPAAIAEVLARGEAVLHDVTVPEGFTAEEIARLLEARGLARADRFLAAVGDPPRFGRSFLASLPTLEGYLFPDTYRLPRGMREDAIVEMFLQRFERVAGPGLPARARATGRPLHEILTIASMVEREARHAFERPLIAGVIYNRLRRGMRLEVDATVLYALRRREGPVTLRDLDADSPYNTYRVFGLPPGPIASPGLPSIEAALVPLPSEFLYYVARPDGTHVFSRTYREHLAAIRAIQDAPGRRTR
ncbi:MAG: endolytic transglycosylase MltG [Armatimonadetes bacterium]|nr:endolytic transglycosylase MltG [Armatimonadota bacterium]